MSSRSVTISRPNDEPVKIPGNGFSLAGTLSKPAHGRRDAAAGGRAGRRQRDRPIATSSSFGIPILGQIAGALADAGFIVLRYDKRGVGQSGGRAESATLADYADDLRAAVKIAVASARTSIRKRIAVVGHSEGGAVALMAAAKDKRIAAVGAGRHAWRHRRRARARAAAARCSTASKLSAGGAAGQGRCAEAIHEAVITGKGWEPVPARRAPRRSTPRSFRACSTTDPAKIDAGRPSADPHRAGRARHAGASRRTPIASRRSRRARKNAAPVEVVKVPASITCSCRRRPAKSTSTRR